MTARTKTTPSTSTPTKRHPLTKVWKSRTSVKTSINVELDTWVSMHERHELFTWIFHILPSNKLYCCFGSCKPSFALILLLVDEHRILWLLMAHLNLLEKASFSVSLHFIVAPSASEPRVIRLHCRYWLNQHIVDAT